MAVLTLEYLPVGYRFSPTDEELINYYLKLKIDGQDRKVEAIPEVDVCKWEPWDLPGLSVIKNEDPEWFFFCPRDQKYPKGRRSNRATEKGYWKATGKDRTIKARTSGMKLIGMKKTLVFHIGRAPGGQRTPWIMHEYRTSSEEEDPFVLFRLFNKEKADSNCDEAEPTGFSPTAASSSPESMRVEKEPVPAKSEKPTGITRWLEDKSDNIASNTSVPEQSYSNSCQASDLEDHGSDIRATGVDAQKSAYNDIFDDPPLETLDQALSPLHVKMSNELGPYYFDSAFESEFGNNNNNILIQDGQDLFDLDFWENVFIKQGGFDDSTSQKHSVESKPDGGCVYVLQAGKDSASASDTDNEVLQAKPYPEGEAFPCFSGPVDDRNEGFYEDEFWNPKNMDLILGDPPTGLDSHTLVYHQGLDSSLVDSPNDYPMGSLHQINPVDDSFGTGVKIRTRHPQHSSSYSLVSQGTAPRRIRLQRKLSRKFPSFKARESNGNAKHQEAKAAVTEPIREVASINVLTLASEDISHELKTKLRLRSRTKSDAFDSDQHDSSLTMKLPPVRPYSYPLRYMFFVALIIVLVVFCVGAWRCLAT